MTADPRPPANPAKAARSRRAALLAALSAFALAALPAPAKVVLPNPDAFSRECSDCHIAYPAWLLPRASWKRIMATLPDHFGEDASLDERTRAEIEAYLLRGAADRGGRTPRWMKYLKPGEVPLRITELPWFTREHGSRLVARAKADPRIGTMSNCAACHKGAERGYFDDD